MTDLQQTNTHHITTLRTSYVALKQAHDLAGAHFRAAVNQGDLDEARKLHNQLMAALGEFREEIKRDYITLGDGRVLLKHEHEALKSFAENNNIELEDVLSRVAITDGSVTEANFKQMGLTTLSGLEGLHRVVELDIGGNRGLTSLTGLPVQALEVLYAFDCGLTGDLTALKDAQKLRDLRVSGNSQLTSLTGVPVQALEVLWAFDCGLTGDLTALQNAQKLRKLLVQDNSQLISLTGIPVQALEELEAFDCGLTGDLTALKDAQNLRDLRVSGNSQLTSLTGVPVQALEKLYALRCGLTGDLTALQYAQNLRMLWVRGNSKLEIDPAQAVINHLRQNHSLKTAQI